MDEKKLEVTGIESTGECDSIPEWNMIVGGEREATSSLEDKPVAVGGGAADGRENHAAVGEPEIFGEGAAETVKMPVDGAGEVIASGNRDSSIVMEVDYAEREVVAEERKASVSDEPLVNKVGDEPVINFEHEMKTEEEIEPASDATLKTDATDCEMQMDGGRDEIFVDTQLETKDENESMQLVESERKSEFPTDVGEVGLNRVMEGTEACNDKHNEYNVGALGGLENDSVERLIIENNTETAERYAEVAEEKGDIMGENLTVVEEEKGDPEIIADRLIAEVETDDGANLVNVCEQEQVHESTNGIEDMSDNGTNMSKDDILDENLSEVEYKEEVLVKADLPVGDIKPEEEYIVESEKTRNAVVEHLSEVETETGTNSIDSKTTDDDGKLETEGMMSDVEEEDETVAAEEEIGTQDTEMETETDMTESGKTSVGGKRRRAKLSKSPSLTKASSRKTVGEDVCFICFDGGELVLCDRRGCPKAYHPSCVNRDEAFFRSKGRWNCGWHLCSICEKNARYMCYTCTFSLCRSCIKNAAILCIRGNKGFCETCMRTVKLIENNEQEGTDAQIDFNDRSSWEYLFKDYYTEFKVKLSLSSDEIAEAKNPWKGANISSTIKTESPEIQADANDGGSSSDDSIENSEAIRPKRKKIRRQSKSQSKKQEPVDSGDKSVTLSENSEWASRELLEFVSHMKNGDTSVLSQFDVQALLLDYVKRNKLRDPRRKSQIVCDSRLENLFGKPRVGHFEMLKFLELHFLTRDEQIDDFQESVVDTENDQLDIDASPEAQTRGVKDKKRKSRKKGDRGPQSNLDDFAAIDMHNAGLIYLRRKLMEDLLEDTETFNKKVVGTFVRIRISGNNQKQDLYRLVQVVGTSKAAERYKVGKNSTDTMIEILNLDKTEIVSIDTISNQEFTEEECKRLRQSIKCGLISRLTVGEILDKTTEIQVARVNDWLESETERLSHLRDRASDLGRRKELRECVEKLQLLKTPEERRRRLEDIPEIHADPKMDPNYESDDNDSESEGARRDAFMRSRGSGFSMRGRDQISPRKDNYAKDSWNSDGKSTPTRNLSVNNFSSYTGHGSEVLSESSWNLERDRSTQESNYVDKLNSATKFESAERDLRSASRPESTSGVVPFPSKGSKINESEKIWHYQDPAGKVQGPFSMVQLRKWNNTGYFPADLKIWRATEKQENSILLVDALAGNFPNELPGTNILNSSNTLATHSVKISGASLLQDNERSTVNRSLDSANDTKNLPSPTLKQSNTSWSRGEASLLTVAVQSPTVSVLLPSPTAVLPNPASAVQNTNFSPTMNSHPGILVSSAGPLNPQTTSMTEPHTHADPPAAVQQAQVVINQNLPETGQAQGYGWATSNDQSSGNFQKPSNGAGIQPDVWRPTQCGQPNMHSPTTPNAPWNMGPQNSNIGWGTMQANPNMGWGNPAPGNTNWGPACPAMQVPPPSGNASDWAPPLGNVNPGWGVGQGWGAPPSQGPMAGNGWGPPAGNVGTPNGGSQGWGPWGVDQSQGGGQFLGQGGGQGRESGFGGGGSRPWNRQSSFGGGGGGGGGGRLNKGDKLCPFNGNGQCRKGSRCDFRHN